MKGCEMAEYRLRHKLAPRSKKLTLRGEKVYASAALKALHERQTYLTVSLKLVTFASTSPALLLGWMQRTM